MEFKRILKSEYGIKLLSIVLGLGLATLFRKVCKGRNCMVFKGPPMEKVKNTIYKILKLDIIYKKLKSKLNKKM